MHCCLLFQLGHADTGFVPARTVKEDQPDFCCEPAPSVSSSNLQGRPLAGYAQQTASTGAASAADGDILQELLRDMYSSDGSQASAAGGHRAGQQGAASRATSERASMSTSHCSDDGPLVCEVETDTSSSEDGIENESHDQPAAPAPAAAAATAGIPTFRAGATFPAPQPASDVNGKQPPVFASSQVSCQVALEGDLLQKPPRSHAAAPLLFAIVCCLQSLCHVTCSMQPFRTRAGREYTAPVSCFMGPGLSYSIL